MAGQLEKLKGSIPPLVTPFRDGEVDYETYGAPGGGPGGRGSATASSSTARRASPRC